MAAEEGAWTIMAIPGVGIRHVYILNEPPTAGEMRALQGPSLSLQRHLDQDRLDRLAAGDGRWSPDPTRSAERPAPRSPGRAFVERFGKGDE